MTTPRSPKSHLQRVPPHDDETEKALLGSALIFTEAAHLVATQVSPLDFYRPSNATVCHAIVALISDGAMVTAASVGAWLRRAGQLDAISSAEGTGHGYLQHLEGKADHVGNAPRLAGYVQEYARRRRMLNLAHDVTEAVYANADVGALVAEMHETTEAQALASSSSWEAVNLAGVLAGDGTDPVPDVLRRNDGTPLLYPARLNVLVGESESGKSWLALLAVYQEMALAHHVLYLDFEDSAEGIVERLLELGSKPETILEFFHYFRPEDPINAAARLWMADALRVWPASLAVIDGVTEAMASSGWSINANDDVALFYEGLPRFIARRGPAVLMIDHVTKDKETRFGRAIGAQHKTAGLSGTGIEVIRTRPFARGATGSARLVVSKDRSGHVRSASVAQKLAGEFVLASTPLMGVSAEIRPATAAASNDFRPTGYMERVSRALEGMSSPITKRELERIVAGKTDVRRTALDALVREGFVRVEEGPKRSQLLASVRAFREEEADSDEESHGIPEQF